MTIASIPKKLMKREVDFQTDFLDPLVELLPTANMTRMTAVMKVVASSMLVFGKSVHHSTFETAMDLEDVTNAKQVRQDFLSYLKETYATVVPAALGTYGESYFLFDAQDDFVGAVSHYATAGDSAISVDGDLCFFDFEEVKKVKDHITKINRPKLKVMSWYSEEDKLKKYSSSIREKQLGMVRDELYPYFEQSVESIVAQVISERAPAYFFIGPPGTGKTSLIRNIAWSWPHKSRVILLDNAHVLAHPSLTVEMRRCRNTLFIVEDCDAFITKRSQGNDQMNGLLNALNGLVPTNNTVIFTTNLPNLKSVDEALLRTGRNGGTFVFQYLNHEQANKVRSVIEKPLIEKFPDGKDKLSLSDVFNYESYLSSHQLPKLGFLK